jgi:N-acetylmuramoyl-L-alanine amidase
MYAARFSRSSSRFAAQLRATTQRRFVSNSTQNEFINESSELAELIQKKLDAVLDIKNRGVRQGGLHVLKGLQMPAVLVEVAFLSNPREEALLMDDEFRRRVCEGIVEAIREFSARGAPLKAGM